MPEGPELRANSLFVNRVCGGRVFTGGVLRSSVSKCPEVPFSSHRYSITSEARGKEVALLLQCLEEPQKKTRLLFRFGMTGRFKFHPSSDIPKHAHLQFHTDEQPSNALCFVDYRRFGSWQEKDNWGEDRGPDPMFEYQLFRQNVLMNLQNSAFNRPICEVLLNQKFFNGIGNYLRAEILFRASVPPFTCARDVLTGLDIATEDKAIPDLLQLCHQVPLEVVEMKIALRKVEDSAVSDEDYEVFLKWLRCYENSEMNNVKDHNGRTMWFKGAAGPMAPKNKRSRQGKGRLRRPALADRKESGGDHKSKEIVPSVVKTEKGEVSSSERDGTSQERSPSPPPPKKQKRNSRALGTGSALRRSSRIKAQQVKSEADNY